MITAQDQQQWGYLLDPCFQLVNTAGKPLTNGYLEVYIDGSRVKYYCASDFTGTLHPFQIPLDSLGSNIVLADPANSYDVYVYNAFGTLLMSRYNVKVSAANAQGGGSAPVTSATVPAMFLGEYGVQVPVLENQTGLPLPLPKGKHNTYTHNADEIIDHYDSEGLYMYLKPGVFFVNATIRFRQNRDNIKNKVTNIKIFTGNGNWNEANVNKIDCTGQHAEDDYNYIHCTFIRVNDSEDTDFGRFSSGILYFRPLVYDSSWESCSIQRLEIVKLNTIGGEGGQSYIPGDYVSIVGNVISVTGVLPESATGDFVQYEEFNTEIQNIHNEIDNLEITVQNATAQIESEIENVTSQIPSDVVTHAELEAATANIPAQVQSDWTESDSSDPSFIQNKPTELSLVEGTNIHITKSGNEVIISADNGATGAVTKSELATATANLQTEIETVTGDVIDTVTSMIPAAQVQSDWTESDTSDPSYIQNKPSEKTLVEGQNVHITASGDYIVISADGGQVTGDYVERDELETVTADVLDQATANVPAQVQSDWTQTVTGDPSYIKHKPDTCPLVAGSGIEIVDDNGEAKIINSDNAQALPIVAGTGVKLSVVNNQVVVSADETVLWEGDKTGTGTITLSEGVNNFESIAVYIGSENINVTAPQKFESLVEFASYSSGQRFVIRYGGELSKSLVTAENGIYIWGGELVVYATSYTTLNVGRTNRAHVSSITKVIDHSSFTHIRKVVGINRIANN